MGRAVQQDFEYRTEHFFFTAPIAQVRSTSAAASSARSACCCVDLLEHRARRASLGTLLPGIDPDRLGPTRFAAYVAPYATVLLPNLLVIGGALLLPRRAHAPDAARLRRQRAAA